MLAKERLYLTAARTALVREGDTKGAFLYAAPGDEIPDSAVEMFGLVDGTLPGGDGVLHKEPAAGTSVADLPGPDELLRITVVEGATPANEHALDFKAGETTIVLDAEIDEAELLAILKDEALVVEAALVGDPSPGWVPFPGRTEAIEKLTMSVGEAGAGVAYQRVTSVPAPETKEAPPAPNKEAAPSPNKETKPAGNKPAKAKAAPAKKKAAQPAASDA